MGDHNHQRLNAAIARRDRAEKTVQRLKGRLSAAQDDVTSIEAECLERGVKPTLLDAAIQQLEDRYEKAMSDFEAEIVDAEGRIAPFTQGDF